MGNMSKVMGRFLMVVVLLQGISVLAKPREHLHLVYVTNRDRAPLPNYTDRLHRIMVDVQDFFRTEMERNGYGPKTCTLDFDKDGKAIIHLVTLDRDFDPEHKFTPKELRPQIAKALLRKGIDIEQEYIMVFENVYWNDGGTWKYDMVYTGSGDPIKGATWVADHEWLDPVNMDPERKESINDRGQKMGIGPFNVKMIGGVAHEFGHGLGLPHNSETKEEFGKYGKALMGAGNYTYRQERLGKKPRSSFLSPVHSFILSLHPLFSGNLPGSFNISDAFPEDLTFDSKDGKLLVSGRVAPADEVAGIVFYHDPVPTGTNKDYDAFSYLAAIDAVGSFATSMPMQTGKECALHFKIYFKNGMHRQFSFIQGLENGLETLRTDYLKERARHVFQQKNVAQLRTLAADLEKVDPAAAKGARLFLNIAEQWDGFRVPAKIDASEKKVQLSSMRWDDATVGWYVPSFNGVLEPDGKWFRPLESSQGKCPQGIYAHAPSRYTYSLGGKWKTLKSRIGIQKGHQAGSVIFIIKGDGKELYRSPLVRLEDGEVPVEVDVSSVQTLELVTESGPDGKDSDWGIWLAPALIR